MGNHANDCPHCGSHGFWKTFTHAVRTMFRLKRRSDSFEHVPIDKIRDNPYQPRSYILTEPHENLKKSIEQYGVIVPIIVARAGDGFVLVAGQRRLVAARELGLKTVPAIVRDMNPRQRMEASYLENLHREDLSRLDLVDMFDRLRRRYPNLNQEALANTMGLQKDDLERARHFRQLPLPVQAALRARMISEEHAPILAEIQDPDIQSEMVELVYHEKLPPEETREAVNRVLRKEPPFVTSDGSIHFHAPHCPYAHLIPEDQRQAFYSKKEGQRRGKLACMQCL
ncbi:MAG: ParB/RepB/Spo0J family partition protein [Planctomycetes bacterium]|nr:ParB/RepB/Spo0J family partition protein [Planctomycetota bacterium]